MRLTLLSLWLCACTAGQGKKKPDTADGRTDASDTPSSDDGGGDPDGGGPAVDTSATEFSVMTHVTTWELEPGTHRPELALTDDGELLVIVVEHIDDDAGRVSHRGYRFDSDFNAVIDPFVVARDTDEYGHPADHRIALVDGTLIVVYQSLITDPDSTSTSGPAEESALEQSLLIARFDPTDGTEIDRQPIVEHVTDFAEENFPDHCVLWHEDRLLVSTGTQASEGALTTTFRIREVDPALAWPANVRAIHTFATSRTTLSSVIGNSLVHGPSGALWIWGSTGPEGTAELTTASLGLDFSPSTARGFMVPERERSFPTGVIFDGEGYWIGHITRDRGGSDDLDENPFYPHLLRVSADLETTYDDEPMPSGSPGAGHVHPHLARDADRLYMAWSRQTADGTPQVVIEVFDISSDSDR